jgi:4-hydroxy-2-oxoheptanedioate aldolase
MIESRKGLENVAAIAQVDGIDLLFAGTVDLGLDMGVAPLESATNPEVQAAVATILKSAHAAGKLAGAAGLGPRPGELVLTYLRAGFDFTGVVVQRLVMGALMGTIEEVQASLAAARGVQ